MLASPDHPIPIALGALRGPGADPAGGQGLGPWLRPMGQADLGAVAALEQAAYAHPWSERIFRDCLAAGYGCWVASDGDRLVGHGVVSVVLDECQVLNVCVCPSRQGRGLGRALLGHLLGIARHQGAAKAFLEVRVSNAPAIGLYRSAGFRDIGVRRGYYPDAGGREDALVMARDLSVNGADPRWPTPGEGQPPSGGLP